MKQEEPEVPNKDFKGFQTLKLSAQSFLCGGPGPQSEAIAMGPITLKPKPMPVRRGDASHGASIPTQPVYTTGRPVIPPPRAPGTGSGPRQPPTPPPSGVVEPEPANDQAKVKFWRDRAFYAEARLAERDRQLQQQGQQILDLSSEDWTEWWEHCRHEFPVHSRPSTRTVRQPPSPSTGRRSRSRSVSTSVTRQTGRSVTPTPRRDRRSVTPTRRGRAGRGPLNNLEEETLQEVEEFEEHLLESFENFPEPLSQATMVCVNGYDRDDLEPHKPWASRLDHTELVEMARRQRREVIQDYPRKPCKDGWMGPVAFEARDNEATLLHNFRWWFFHCKKGSMPPFRYDGAID